MNDPIQILHSCFVGGLVWAFWQYGWKKFALDSFRQSLFSIRADLFLLAASHPVLVFQDKAYVSIRDMLNARIRFAHKVSFVKVAVVLLAATVPGLGLYSGMKDFKPAYEKAIAEESDPALKAAFTSFNERSIAAFIRYLLMTSPFFLIISLLTFVVVVIACLCHKGFWALVTKRMQTELARPGRVVALQADSCDIPTSQAPVLCAA